jgi:hypothetical protein
MFHRNTQAKQETSRRQQAQFSLLPASAGFFLGLFFDPEDEGNKFLQYEDTTYVVFRRVGSINYQMFL